MRSTKAWALVDRKTGKCGWIGADRPACCDDDQFIWYIERYNDTTGFFKPHELARVLITEIPPKKK